MFSKVQLWQFLLELLTDDTNSKIIKWEGDYGEFRMNDPEEVAKLWGRRSGRRKMTYQTMSRALRHYYCKDVLYKVKHKKWCYRFSFDTLEMARTVLGNTNLPATEKVYSEKRENYESALAYEEYLNSVYFSLPMPKVNLYPSDDVCYQNSMKWPLVACFGDYGMPVLYSTYSYPRRSF